MVLHCAPVYLLGCNNIAFPDHHSFFSLSRAFCNLLLLKLNWIVTIVNVCPKYAQDMHKIRPKYIQDMPKMCQRYARERCSQDMPRKCPRYAQDKPKICPRYAQDMPKTCPRYAQDMPKTCLRHAQDIPKISPKNAQDMREIWLVLGLVLAGHPFLWLVSWSPWLPPRGWRRGQESSPP